MSARTPIDEVRSLFRRLHLLNRVHNSADFSEALTILQDWTARLGFRGSCRIIDVPAGGEYNFWRVPHRWVVRRFSVRDRSGREIVNEKSHPLSLTPFSDSFSGEITREELLEHVHSREDLPDAIPYVFRKMYRHWEKGWAIAIPDRVRQTLRDSHYH